MRIKVAKVTEEKHQEIIELVRDAVKDETSMISDLYAYDISFWSGGEEFKPEVEIKLTFQMPKERSTENEISCLVEEFSIYGVVRTTLYGQINYKDIIQPFNVIMRMSDDCGVCSMATIEAYVNKSTNHDYYWNQVYRNNGNSTFCNWNNNGYYNVYQTNNYNTALNEQGAVISKLYSELKKGSCIVGNGHHFAVVVAYIGNGSVLNKKDFVVMG